MSFGGTGQICLHLRTGMCADKGSARSSPRQQRSSALHLIIQICPSRFLKRKKDILSDVLWRYWPDLNWRITVLQTGALPLGYSTKIGAGDEARTRYLHLGKVALYRMSYARIYGSLLGTMVPPVGIEPTTRGFSVHCSTD